MNLPEESQPKRDIYLEMHLETSGNDNLDGLFRAVRRFSLWRSD